MTNIDFKVGDKVKCIECRGSDDALVLDQIYIVSSATNERRITRVEGVPSTWFSGRFELVEAFILPEDRFIEQVLKDLGIHAVRLEDIRRWPTSNPTIVYAANLLAKLDKYEPQPKPVDPDLLIARKSVADMCHHQNNAKEYLKGTYDHLDTMKTALAAIKAYKETV